MDVVHDQGLCGVHMSPDRLPEFETEDENRQRQGCLRPVTAETSLQTPWPSRSAPPPWTARGCLLSSTISLTCPPRPVSSPGCCVPARPPLSARRSPAPAGI